MSTAWSRSSAGYGSSCTASSRPASSSARLSPTLRRSAPAARCRRAATGARRAMATPPHGWMSSKTDLPMSDDQIDAAAAKMREAGQSEAAIRQFTSALERVLSGAATLIPSSELEPAPHVPELDELPGADAAMVLERLAVIRLNGGLAT